MFGVSVNGGKKKGRNLSLYDMRTVQNPEKGEHPLLEAVARGRLKSQLTEKTKRVLW
jgi:hypothetical protein